MYISVAPVDTWDVRCPGSKNHVFILTKSLKSTEIKT